MLVPPETFAEQAPGAVADHRAADFLAGDHAEPGAAPGGQLVPVGNQAALRQPFADLPHARKIAAVRKARRAAQTQAPGAGIGAASGEGADMTREA